VWISVKHLRGKGDSKRDTPKRVSKKTRGKLPRLRAYGTDQFGRGPTERRAMGLEGKGVVLRQGKKEPQGALNFRDTLNQKTARGKGAL